MGQIIVNRIKQGYGVAQPMGVYLDGKHIGSVESGGSKTFEVGEGKHSLYVHWTLVTKSPAMSFEIGNDEVVRVEAGHCVPKWMMLTLFPHLMSMLAGRTYLYAKIAKD